MLGLLLFESFLITLLSAIYISFGNNYVIGGILLGIVSVATNLYLISRNDEKSNEVRLLIKGICLFSVIFGTFVINVMLPYRRGLDFYGNYGILIEILGYIVSVYWGVTLLRTIAVAIEDRFPTLKKISHKGVSYWITSIAHIITFVYFVLVGYGLSELPGK